MARITPIDPTSSTGATRRMLDGVHAALGVTPNLMKTLAVAPAALKGYLDLNQALGGGVLDLAFRERIALTVAQANACNYCLSAHTVLGGMAGLAPDEIARGREARSADSRREAGLQFARAVVVDRGQVSDEALARVRAAGYADAEIVEIVVNVALNVLTNYINHVAQTAIDFPVVETATAPAAA